MSTASVPSTARSPQVRRARLHRLRNALVALLVGAAAALAAGELLLRYAVTHPTSLGAFGRRIRQPQNFADGDSDDDYWKLFYGWQDPAKVGDAEHPDPVIGWAGSYVTAGTYEHVNERLIHGRQLVILYGDSYSQCNTPPEECFQSLLEESEFGRDYCLLNYGVGGYGLDQIYLLLERSIDRFADRDPIVIVGMLPESDLDRSVLSFRDWPKPRLDVVDGELVPRGPVTTDARKYLAEHPVSIRSYLWRYFLFNPTRFLMRVRTRLQDTAPIIREKKALCRKILEEIERSLARRHLRHFFLFFHAEPAALHTWEVFRWQDELVHDVCRELAIPCVDTRDYLAFASDRNADRCAKLYGQSGREYGHHNAAGNLVCFEAIRSGLRGEFDVPDLAHLAMLKRQGVLFTDHANATPMILLGRGASVISPGVHLEEGRRIDVVETRDPAQLLFRAEAAGPTRLRFELAGEARRLRGTLRSMPEAGARCADVEVEFTIEVDGDSVMKCALPRGGNGVPIDVDLSGKQRLELVASGASGPAICIWACIDRPVLE